MIYMIKGLNDFCCLKKSRPKGEWFISFFLFVFFVSFRFSLISQNFDIELLQKINKNSSPFMDKVFPVITESASPISIGVPLELFIISAKCKDEEMKKKSYMITASFIIANGVAVGMKYGFNRQRPFVTYPKLIVKKSAGGSPSFPSGHTTTAFSTATALSLAYPKWYVIAPAYLWACSVGYSRMYLGVHYPSDVAAGIIIGSGFSYLAYKGQLWLEKKAEKKKENPVNSE